MRSNGRVSGQAQHMPTSPQPLPNGREEQHFDCLLGDPSCFCQSSAMHSDRGIAALAQLIAKSERAVVFTGAGISTESGIPDFRCPGGIWTRMAPIYFQDFIASEEARRETWRRRFAMEDMFKTAEPNRGHRAVEALVRRGKVAPSSPRTSTGCTRPRASRPRSHRAARQHDLRHMPRLQRRYEIDALRLQFEADDSRRAAPLQGLGQDRDGLVRPGDARRADAPGADRDARRRSLHRAGVVAGGLSRGRLPRTRQAQRRHDRDCQPRGNRTGPPPDLSCTTVSATCWVAR